MENEFLSIKSEDTMKFLLAGEIWMLAMNSIVNDILIVLC